MTSVRFIPTEEKYIEGFNAAIATVARERRYIGLVEGPPIGGTRAFVRALLTGGGVQFLAVDGETVVGWCDIDRGQLEGFRHVGRLGMGLLPDYRSRGLGRRLAEIAIAAAISAGMERIELEVFASNEPAIALYRKLGFAVEGVKVKARKLDDIYDDNVFMARITSP